MSVDKQEIYKLSIKDVAKSLGIEVIGNRGRCFNKLVHRNGDRNPSLIFGIKTNVWKCPVCNFDFKYSTSSGYGSAIDLVMLCNNLDYRDALQWFVETYSIQDDNVSKRSFKARQTPLNKGKAGYTIPAKSVFKEQITKKDNSKNIEIYSSFIEYLGTMSDIGKKYLNGRGISNFLIQNYNLTDIKDNKKTEDFLKENFTMEDLIESGLFRISDKTKKPYFAYFKHRLIFPFYKDDAVVYVQGRDINPDGKVKYYNSGSEVPCPYNVNLVFNNPDIEGELVYITEGIIDCLSLMEMGYNAIGIIGIGGFKRDWVSMLKNVKVFLAFDNEEKEQIQTAVKKSVQNIVNLFAEVNGQAVGFISPKDLKGFDTCKDWNEVLIKKKTEGLKTKN